MGGRGVTVGTGELVGVADGVRDWVAVGVGDPVGVSSAAAGKIVRLAANVSPADTIASTATRSSASLKSRLTWRLGGEVEPCAAPLNSVPQTTQREEPGLKRVPQVGHKEAEASVMKLGAGALYQCGHRVKSKTSMARFHPVSGLDSPVIPNSGAMLFIEWSTFSI